MKCSSVFDSRCIARCLTVFVALAASGFARAQEGDGDPTAKFRWKEGPGHAEIGKVAEIKLPEKFRFIGEQDTQRMLQLMQNPTSGDELGLIMPGSDADPWFVVFEFSEVGYVKDDDKDSLDADAMLDSIRRGTAAGNKEREKRGWPTMEITGWAHPPHYDDQSQNLEWAINATSEGHEVVNYNTRILGRKGVMEVSLVVDPSRLQAVLPEFKALLRGYYFTPGNKYAEFKSGDKIAEYGLAALVTGGAAAVALKTGILQKFWKLIVAAVIGVVAVFRGVIRRLFGGSSAE